MSSPAKQSHYQQNQRATQMDVSTRPEKVNRGNFCRHCGVFCLSEAFDHLLNLMGSVSSNKVAYFLGACRKFWCMKIIGNFFNFFLERTNHLVILRIENTDLIFPEVESSLVILSSIFSELQTSLRLTKKLPPFIWRKRLNLRSKGSLWNWAVRT